MSATLRESPRGRGMRGTKKGEDYHVADVAARLAAYATSGALTRAR